MKKIVLCFITLSLLISPFFAKPKEPSKKQREEFTDYIKQAFENDMGFNPYSFDNFNNNKEAEYIYIEKDIVSEDFSTAVLTDTMIYKLKGINFEQFEKLSSKDTDKLLNGSFVGINENTKKSIEETVEKLNKKNQSRIRFNSDSKLSIDKVYTFSNISLEFENTAGLKKIYSSDILFIGFAEPKGYLPNDFHILNKEWCEIGRFIASYKDIENSTLTKGLYLLDKNFLSSFSMVKETISASKPRGIEKDLLDFYGTYKIYSTSYFYKVSRRSAIDLDNVDLLYFDDFDFSYKLGKGYKSNAYIMDSNDSYIGYNGKMPTLESDLVRFIIDDKANVITETKVEKNSFQSGTYYESVYKFDTNKEFLLKNTHKTQAVEMQFGSDRYYPIYETVLITKDSPLYGKKSEMKNYRHIAK